MYLPDESILAKYAIKTHYIVKVIAVHPETQTVDVVEDVYRFVNSMVPFTTITNELGNEVDVALAKRFTLKNIPIKQERWGQFTIQCNPAVGDTGYIEIMTNDIRDWLLNGSESVPLSDVHFDERSCVFVPFVQNATNKQDSYPTDNTQLIIKSDHLSITMTDQPDDAGAEPQRDIAIVGDVNVTGNVSVTGTIEATGEISSQTDVVVKTLAGSVSLLSHTHESAAPGSPTSSPILVPNP